MNKDAIIQFIKKNLISLICGLVAIGAIVAAYIPIGGWFDELRDSASTRANNYDKLAGFTRAPRKLPVVDPSKSASDAAEFTTFPNPTLIKLGNDIDAKLIAQSKSAFDYVKELSATGHTLLVPGVLPDSTQSQTTALKFAEVYTKVLSTDPTVTGVGYPDAKPPVPPDATLESYKAMNLINDILKGGMPPTPKQISDAQLNLYHGTFEPRIYSRNGVPVNKAEVEQDYEVEKLKVPQQLKIEVAKSKKIYVENKAFEASPAIDVTKAPDSVSVWYAQLSEWIQKDVATAIAEANAPSTNILDAQVKHLISLQIPPQPMLTFPPAGTDPQAGIGGVPSPATETQVLPLAYSLSPTGRASNAMYDVIHFTLVIDVDAAHVNDVIQTFSKGRLISIYRQDLYAVDNAHEAADGFLYGNSRVVRLSLQGEILFLRAWTTQWMPDAIKTALGVAGAPPRNPGGVFPPMSGNQAFPGAMPQR